MANRTPSKSSDLAPVQSQISLSQCESELVQLVAELHTINDHLNRAVANEDPLSESILLNLNRKWENACSLAAKLPASTSEARRAKASILIVALEVLAPALPLRELHEQLAESLARDLLR